MSERLSRYRKPALVVSGIALAACSVFIPKKTDHIIFSHSAHSEAGIECDNCHGEVAKDAQQAIKAIPRKPQCAECHEEEVKKDCKKCHTEVKSPASWEASESTIIFSHQMHLNRKTKCMDCHGGVTQARSASSSQPAKRTPRHEQCKNCHRADLEAGRCRLCHTRLDLYTKKPESLYSHPEGFMERHGKEAAASGQEHCSVCHDQSHCADCHARTMTVRPSLRFPENEPKSFMHAGDWQGRHVIEARASEASCIKCHGRSSCNACHERVGVGGRLGGSPHRDQGGRKWAPESPEAADFNCNGDFLHGRAARRRITECAACHEQGPATICVRCHSAKNRGCKPHPPGYKPPVGDRENNKMCRTCH
jgi:hypothetical protein